MLKNQLYDKDDLQKWYESSIIYYLKRFDVCLRQADSYGWTITTSCAWRLYDIKTEAKERANRLSILLSCAWRLETDVIEWFPRFESGLNVCF